MFSPYSLDIPFSSSDYLASVPDDATARGMYFETLQKVREQSGLARMPGKWIPFKSYSRQKWLELSFQTAVDVCGDVPKGLYKIGQRIYKDFADSLIGKTLFVISGSSFKDICRVAPKGYSASNNYGELRVISIDDKNAHVHFDGIWDPIHLTAGLIDTALDVAGRKADFVLCTSTGPANIEFKVQYSKK